MFVVRDSDTTVYLFGTFHALDGDANWFGPCVRNAFEESNELVLETLLPEGPDAAAQLRQVDAPRSQSSSFLNTTRMAISAGRLQGMQVANGADMVLRHTAEAEGKSVEGLETLQLQLNMFNSMPPPSVATGPNAPKAGQSVDDQQSLSVAISEMQSAWKLGDQRVFVRLLDQLQQRVPGGIRELVRLVEDVDLVAALDRLQHDALADLADVVDAALRGGVHLDHVERGSARDRDAGVGRSDHR